MTNCQGCGTEILSQDHFCKNCGAPVAACVEDLADTQRFDPSAPAASARTGSLDPNSQFYVAGAATYPIPQAPVQPSRTSPLIKKLLRRNVVWVLAFVLLFLCAGTGYVIARDMRRAQRAAKYEAERHERRVAESKRQKRAQDELRTFEEAIQNSMGFIPAMVPAQEYPETEGIFVTTLISDTSPAALAQIEAGDVLTEFNGQPIRSPGEMLQALKPLKPGSEVGAKLFRDDKPVSVRIRVGSQSIPPFQPKVEPRSQGFLGIGNAVRHCCVQNSKRWGLEIRRIVDNSPADLAGLQEGDLITEFDSHIVRTADEFARYIHNAKPRTKVKVKFYRGSVEQTAELLLGHGW